MKKRVKAIFPFFLGWLSTETVREAEANQRRDDLPIEEGVYRSPPTVWPSNATQGAGNQVMVVGGGNGRNLVRFSIFPLWLERRG